MTPKPKTLRCAIYTRKSTEEGLDQAFNSLHAQREACEAYVKSQAGEGWIAVPSVYDDGGFSGGSLNRPALQKLLKDVDNRLIDVVVVYKVDRLTRSLADFAKIVERFEGHSVSFVSVTQAFNTTTSMGRLTLNVLLSFAQFEREVTGERIRDKFAASRKKGMWMGGNIPTGYDLVARKLIVNPKEAETVRLIFRRYLELKSVLALRDDLKSKGITSKSWISETGQARGGVPFDRGGLYALLQNRVYIGETVHKKVAYSGEHEAIISRDLFEEVQSLLGANRRRKQEKPKTVLAFPLTGLIFDDRGNPMTPSQSQRGKLRYRYYVSHALIVGKRKEAGSVRRVPAQAIEDLVVDQLKGLGLIDTEGHALDQREMRHSTKVLVQLVRRVELGDAKVIIQFEREAAREILYGNGEIESDHVSEDRLEEILRSRCNRQVTLKGQDEQLVLSIPIRATFRGGRRHIISPEGRNTSARSPRADRALAKAIARAHSWLGMLLDGRARSIGELAKIVSQDRGYVSRVLRMAFLSPTITTAILEGRQEPHVSATDLITAEIPLSWRKQQLLIDS